MDRHPAQLLQEIVEDLSGLVRVLREEGAPPVEMDPETLAALGRLPVAAPFPVGQASAPPPPPAPSILPRPSPSREPVPPTPPAPERPARALAAAPAIASAADDGPSRLAAIAARIASCTQCPLCRGRARTVPGQGCASPDIAFIGEGPGAEEDRQGLAFVGAAGQLLTKMIGAMGYTRDEVWIGNIIKCRPPGNRTPYPDEMEACIGFLREQLALLKPKVIVCLGATAVRGLLKMETGITQLRGRWMAFQDIPVMPTYHPAALLLNETMKRPVWEDLQEVLRKLGRAPPERPRR